MGAFAGSLMDPQRLAVLIPHFQERLPQLDRAQD